MSSRDDMYPPPGSCQYAVPKPLCNGNPIHYEKEIVLFDLCSFCRVIFSLFKPKFWKFVMMLLLLIVVLQIYDRFVFKHRFISLFTISEISQKRVLVQFHKDAKNDKSIFPARPTNTSHTASPLTPNQMKIFHETFSSRQFLNKNHPENSRYCPPVPPNLKGHEKPTIDRVPSLGVQEKMHSELQLGGHYHPAKCTARSKVAIIIPFRDRATHLSIFLYNIHPFLQRQQIDYAIYLIEQAGGGKFNRAMLMNVGSIEALKIYDYNCFIFHDIDLIPEDDRNLYTCPEQPRHMSVSINTMGYRLPYNDIFGGVSSMTVSHFKKVNGFSNRFWGWGGEDDDMSNRIKFHNLHISRYPANVARYTMMSHKKDKPNPLRFKFLNEGRKNYKSDGLSNIKYKILDIQLQRLYTWIYVDLKGTAIRKL